MLRFRSQSSLMIKCMKQVKCQPFAPMKRNLMIQQSRMFSTQSQTNNDELMMDDLEIQALNIQRSIDQAKSNITHKTQAGIKLSRKIGKDVEEDKFIKMQRYDIFISKMEQLSKAEQRWKRDEKHALFKMQSAFVNSQKPLKDLLFYYNKASVRGFDSSLVSKTLHQINLTLKARGNQPRVYDDYTTREFDQSWRMQTLAGHIKQALSDEMYFNHYFLGSASRQLGEIAFKDTEIIQKSFSKLHSMLDERDNGGIKPKDPLDFETVVYGNFQNFIPRHYVFDGFESSEEFQKHLNTLVDWQVENKDGQIEAEMASTPDVLELETSLAHLINACNELKDMQVGMEASIDSLRQQFFKLQEAGDKHKFMEENKFIHYDMMELQELLVRAGYIDPEEAQKFSAEQPFNSRMQRATQIFYEYCQNYAPELMSPQYDKFIDAAQSNLDQRKTPKQRLSLDEMHDNISLSSLSQTLVGLSQQALSFRREANDKDYLHQYYEDRATQGEIKDPNDLKYQISHLWEGTTVKMARDYLKAWDIFDREIDQIWPRFKKLIVESHDDIEGQLYCLYGMSACKIEAPQEREQVFENLKRLLNMKEGNSPRTQALIDGFTGIALQSDQTESSKQIGQLLINNLDNRLESHNELHSISFDQKLDILWAACALGVEQNSQCVRNIYTQINNLNFQRTDNDLTFEQFEKVRDFQLYLTKISPAKDASWVKDNINESLDLLANNANMHSARYAEHQANFDPFKKRVLIGMARGLTMASIDHQVTLENNLVHQNEQDMGFNDNQYPYRPDMIIGHKGQKVLMNVIPSSETMRDVKQADGKIKFRHRMLKMLNADQNVKTVAIPINSVVNYDIEKLKISMNEDYNFVEDLLKQINQGSPTNQATHSIDFDLLGQFGASFTRNVNLYLNSLKNQADKKRVEKFLEQLYKLFQIKQQTEKQYEKVIYQQGLDTLKFELMKLQLLFDSMPKHQQKYLNQFVPSEGDQQEQFQNMIKFERDSIKMRVVPESHQEFSAAESQLNLNWQGTRLEVELPQIEGQRLKKNIVPEIINQKFMWVDDYFHYEDWEHAQKETFDAFNLTVVPRKENDYKYFYDRTTHQRIIPQGIFPNPNHKRVLLEPQVSLAAQDINDSTKKGYDEINQFERDPFKMMVVKEQQRSLKQKSVISSDLSFQTNLNNIKQGLKQDYSDKEILDLILVNAQFTNSLIEEHLNGPAKDDQDLKYAPRDPAKYRDFVHSTYYSKDQQDPYSHFFLKESGKIERVYKVQREADSKYQEAMESTQDIDTQSNIKSNILKSFEQKIEDMLLENHRENDDITSISHQMDVEVKVDYDLKTLMRSETISDIDPEIVAEDISDQVFLSNQRRRAETKLIKSRIIYKQDQGMPLSRNEQKYLQKWVRDIKSNQHLNLMNLRDSMLPHTYSKSALGKAMTAEDMYAFNQIPHVELEREKHGQYAINDLVLELSHFIDDEVVNRVEMQMMSERLIQEWDLSKDFQIIETRNKEIGMVMNEMEELAWRTAGQFEQVDLETLNQMFSITRGKDSFDREYFDNDMKSMNQFISTANSYDQRIELLEEWVVRKETEYKSRVVLPPNSMKQPDFVLHQQIDHDLKKARQQIVSKFLQSERNYDDLTTTDLHKISESISVRLNLFGGEYPAFMPQAVKAVIEHPNLSKCDRSKLDTFCRMFELDWRGDRTLESKKEFLSTNPVYFDESDRSSLELVDQLGPGQASGMIRRACQPFVEDLTTQLIRKAEKDK